MRYLSVGLFHQNKFPGKFIGPSLFFPWLFVFCYLTDAFFLVLFMSSTSHPHALCRSSRSQMFFKIGVPKNFADFTRKHRYFPAKFAKFLRTRFFAEHLCGCFYLFCFPWMFLLLLLPCRTSTTSLQYCYFLRLKKHFCLYITTTTSLLS